MICDKTETSRIDFNSVWRLILNCPHYDYDYLLSTTEIVANRKQVASYLYIFLIMSGGVSAQEWIFCFNYCIDIPSCGETAL